MINHNPDPPCMDDLPTLGEKMVKKGYIQGEM